MLAFFEIGLFASYSVISSGPVNPADIISTQIDEGIDFISSLTGEKKLDEQDTLNITNKEEVALILNNMTNLSVNLQSVTAKISDGKTGNQTVTITALATKDAQSVSGGAIVIIPEQSYSISATATGEVYSSKKVKINVTTISLKERIVLYNQNNQTGSSNGNSSIDSLLESTKNKSNQTHNNTTTNNTNNSYTNSHVKTRA